MQIDPLKIQHKIEEKRLILGSKFEDFLLKKISILASFFARVFSSQSTALIGSTIIFFISVFIRSTRDIGQDSGLYLEVTQKLLNGGKYYIDFFENNLPLSYFFTAIPIFLARIFGVSQIIALEIFVNLIGIFTIYFSAKILLRSEISKDRAVFNLFVLTIAAGFFLRIFTLQFNDFGTKSTYFLAFAFPYLAYQFLSETQLKKTDQIFLGVLAALLICLKPHYGILIAAFEGKKIYQQKSLKPFFSLQNFVTFFLITFYVAILFVCFSDYIKAIPAFASLYFDSRYFYLIFPLKEDIYPLLLLLFPCFFLREKFSFLRPLFLTSLVFCIVLATELTGVYDQRVLLYSLSLPLVSLLILVLIRDQQINWHRDFITLLLILLIPQFDRSFFVTTAFNICAFWWILVLANLQKWRKIISIKDLQKCGSLRHIFLPREPLSWFCFSLFVVFTIKLSATRTTNNLAWGFSAIIFVLLVNFYHNLERKFVSREKFSLLSASVIFVVLSYFVSLQLAAIFNEHEYKSPNSVNDRVAEISQKYLSADENFVMISGRILGSYPMRNYLEKTNFLPASQLQNLYVKIDNHDAMSKVDSYLFSRLKDQINNPKNKLLFVEDRGLPASDSCRISFMEYYLRDSEFRKILTKNYKFLERIIAIKPAEKSVNFFSDQQVKSYSLVDGDKIKREIEVYVRK